MQNPVEMSRVTTCPKYYILWSFIVQKSIWSSEMPDSFIFTNKNILNNVLLSFCSKAILLQQNNKNTVTKTYLIYLRNAMLTAAGG